MSLQNHFPISGDDSLNSDIRFNEVGIFSRGDEEMKIVLLGFMGSGKSSIARELSRVLEGAHLDTTTVELDEELVSRSSYTSIEEIFHRKGEPWFRNREAELFAEQLEAESSSSFTILSPGGGIIESDQSCRFLAQHPVFWEQEETSRDGVLRVFLDTPFETLFARILSDGESGDQRPLAKGAKDRVELREQLELRYRARLHRYRELSDIIVPTEHHSVAELALVIASFVGAVRSSVRLRAVIGDPVSHSRSPRLHNSALRLSEDERFFLGVRVVHLKPFFRFFRENPALQALAVTIPHKETVVPLLDELSDHARELGAVNTVVKREGAGSVPCCSGENTDWLGISNPLKERGGVSGKSIAVLGAGGTARAALYAVRHLGGKGTIINRSPERGAALARELGVPFRPLAEVSDLREFDGVIQTTSVGMVSEESSDDDPVSLFTAAAFREGMVVMDVVYTPPRTRFLLEAERGGAEIIGGEELFIAQARAQYHLHNGEVPPVRVFEKAMEEEG
ncbi:AAA family ATPase [bacterium]|nr:AAA family ATPase [bacterium]